MKNVLKHWKEKDPMEILNIPLTRLLEKNIEEELDILNDSSEVEEINKHEYWLQNM